MILGFREWIELNEGFLLLENRIQYLKDHTKELDTSHDTLGVHKTPEDIIQHFADHGDPTKNKAHTQYLVNLYKNKSIRQEDAPRVHQALSNFEKYKAKLAPEDKQVNTKTYPSIGDVEEKIAPHLGTMASKREAKVNLDQPGHELKYEDDKIKVYHLSDKEASQNLYGGGHERGGTGTSWCTAARSKDNMFDRYHKEGNLFVVHNKDNGNVYQYHPASTQFMDKKDQTISHKDFGEIADNLHKAWDKHPELAK